MKRYLIFAYDRYYPSGGMDDFISDIDNLLLLEDILKDIEADLFHVYDTLENKYIIKETYIVDFLKNQLTNLY
jgi:hypothetical protein